ncbi:MAG: hypothetical protein K6U74_07275 [Firmicutes bacterium]|nr:hypothetical protein [Bacillota bacterium]
MSDFFVFGFLSLAATTFVWKLIALAASKTDFQGSFFSYLSQVGAHITAQDVLVAAGTALLFPLVAFALFFVSVLAAGIYCRLAPCSGKGAPIEKGVSIPSAPRLPESPEEAEMFARSGDPEKRRLAVRSPVCPLEVVWNALADSDKKVRLNALCRLVAAGAVTEGKAQEIFSSWEEYHRRYAEKNFSIVMEAYSKIFLNESEASPAYRGGSPLGGFR